jgi:hypothetical protein
VAGRKKKVNGERKNQREKESKQESKVESMDGKAEHWKQEKS